MFSSSLVYVTTCLCHKSDHKDHFSDTMSKFTFIAHKIFQLDLETFHEFIKTS